MTPSDESKVVEQANADRQVEPANRGSGYGFGGRLTQNFPSQVIVDLTEVCNLACTHCPHPEFKRSSHYAARYLEPELHTKLINEVRSAGKGHVQYLRYTSEGEPLVHPRGYDMLEEAVVDSGVFVTLTTNGTIMNERRTRRLLETGVHMIDISIDAFLPETYSKIRVHGDLAVTRANVLNLISWVQQSGSHTSVVVSFIEQPENAGEAQDFERFWREAGATEVIIRRLHSAGAALPEQSANLWAQLEGKERKPCLYPWERISLNPRGWLGFCPVDWVHGSEVADYRTVSIEEVWQGEFYQRLRAAHLKNHFANHAFCGRCPDWALTRWPGEGRSYADLIQELRG